MSGVVRYGAPDQVAQGRCRPRGSHRPVRARTRAYGSSTSRFTIPRGTSKLLRPMTWTCCRASMCSARFLSRACWVGASLSSTGSSEASSPASTVLSKRYDVLPSIPSHFVFLRLAVPHVPLVRFAPRRTSVPPRPGVEHPVSPAGTFTRRRLDLPSSRGTPIVRLPCSSDAGRTACTRPLRCGSMALGM